MILGGLRIIGISNGYIVFRVIGWIPHICSSTSSEVSRYSWIILWWIVNRYVFCSTLSLIHKKRGNFHKIIQNQRSRHSRLMIKNRTHNQNRYVIVCLNDSKTMGNDGLYKLYIANYQWMVWVFNFVATVNDHHSWFVCAKAIFNIKLPESAIVSCTILGKSTLYCYCIDSFIIFRFQNYTKNSFS